MGVPSRYILHQGPVLSALARGAVGALRQRGRSAGPAPTTPGPEISIVAPPRPPDLVRSYVRHVGGDPAVYRGELPPHLFPQWVFPLQARTLEGLSYPLMRVLNGGYRLEINAPLPADRPLRARARIEDIDDDGRRARIHQRAVTGTDDHPEALVTHLFVVVPLGKGGEGKRKDRARVPRDAREIAFWRIGADAGLSFAKLTGDFNPIHWVPAYARAFGFPNVILHGFSTAARAFEGLARHLFAGDSHHIASFDVRFTRPLVLPARVGLYLAGEDQVYVGDAPGGPAYLVGTYGARS